MADPTLAEVEKAIAIGLVDLGYCARSGLPVTDAPSARIWLCDLGRRDFALSAAFDPAAYMARYPDIRPAPIHPVIHYLRYGMAEGRAAFPVFVAALAGMAEQPRAVWIETHDLGLTGAPLALCHLLRGWPDLAKAAILGAPSNGPLGDAFTKIGCRVVVHAQSARHATTDEDFDDVVARCRAALRASGARAVVGNSVMAWPMVCAGIALGLPTAWIIHEPDGAEIAAIYPADIFARFTSRLSKVDRLIFVSSDSRAAWAAAQMPHATVIEKALPPQDRGDRATGRRTVGAKPMDMLILSVGSLSPRKGQADLVEALAHLADTPIAPDLVAVLVGYAPSPYAETVRQTLGRLRQRGMRAILLPESRTMQDRRNIAHLFAAADVFVMSSRAESLPLTTAEALAAGCPVIATDVPGIAEMVIAGQTGLHYPPGDIVALAQHIASLAGDPGLRARMRQAIAARPLRDDYPQMIAAYQRELAGLGPIPAAATISPAKGKTSSR
ncbi:glycosyltransferase [Rhodobacterales bacterium LSUCC0031]|nr:glycosyltransferase [Rhodobacterales bacterium LSUCC0031]